jgi:hypothetical protein
MNHESPQKMLLDGGGGPRKMGADSFFPLFPEEIR